MEYIFADFFLQEIIFANRRKIRENKLPPKISCHTVVNGALKALNDDEMIGFIDRNYYYYFFKGLSISAIGYLYFGKGIVI